MPDKTPETRTFTHGVTLNFHNVSKFDVDSPMNHGGFASFALKVTQTTEHPCYDSMRVDVTAQTINTINVFGKPAQVVEQLRALALSAAEAADKLDAPTKDKEV